MEVAGAEPVLVANRIQSPSVRGNVVKGPYLALTVVGKYPDTHRFEPLRAYAQPVYSGRRFVPVESGFEREVLRTLLAMRPALSRSGIELAIEKPVFDKLTDLGPCKPDFILEARSQRTGEVRELVVEAMGFASDEYLAAKAITHPRMARIAPVVSVPPEFVANGGLFGVILDALHSWRFTTS